MLPKATPREVDRPYYSQPPHPTPPPSDDINRFSWSLKAAIETSRAIRAQRVLEQLQQPERAPEQPERAPEQPERAPDQPERAPDQEEEEHHRHRHHRRTGQQP